MSHAVLNIKWSQFTRGKVFDCDPIRPQQNDRPEGACGSSTGLSLVLRDETSGFILLES